MDLLYTFFPLSLFTFIVFVFLSKNPVYGVLSFVAVVMHIVVLLVLLDLEFLAYVLAIVYIGAIVVLFLFVIMMFYIHHFTLKRSFLRGSIEYYILGWLITNISYYITLVNMDYYFDFIELSFTNNIISVVAYYLFNDGLMLTTVITLIMLIGVVGAIILTIKNPLFIVKNFTPFTRNLITDTVEKKQL